MGRLKNVSLCSFVVAIDGGCSKTLFLFFFFNESFGCHGSGGSDGSGVVIGGGGDD